MKLMLLFFLITPISSVAQNLFSCPIYTSDIDNFFTAFDELQKDTTQNPFENYVAVGSPGLSDLNRQRIGGVSKLKQYVLKRNEFYGSIREQSHSWINYRDRIDFISQKMTSLIQGVHYPNIYLVIGIENTGATITDNGIVVGLETLCYGTDVKDPLGLHRTMQNLPEVIAAMIVYANETGFGGDDLLQRAISAGIAKYLAGELTKEQHLKNSAWDKSLSYGEEHRCALWNEFVTDRDNKEMGNWFGKYDISQPADIGEWIGYKIVTEYLKESKGKSDAVAEILNISSMRKFTEEKMILSYCK